MKKKMLCILISGFTLILCSLIIIPTIKKPDYIIHYYSGLFTYDIEVKKKNMLVRKKEIVQCIKAPCEPIEIDNFKVKYKDEYKKLIKNLFKNEKSNEITISKTMVNEDDIKILSSIVKEKLEN